MKTTITCMFKRAFTLQQSLQYHWSLRVNLDYSPRPVQSKRSVHASFRANEVGDNWANNLTTNLIATDCMLTVVKQDPIPLLLVAHISGRTRHFRLYPLFRWETRC